MRTTFRRLTEMDDKNDTHYFQTTMSQSEFERLIGGDQPIPPYKFNMIRKETHGRSPMSGETLAQINRDLDSLFEKVSDIEEMICDIYAKFKCFDFSQLEALMEKIKESSIEIEKKLDECNEKFFDSVTRNTTKLSTMINEYKGFVAIERAKTAKFNASIRDAIEKFSEE